MFGRLLIATLAALVVWAVVARASSGSGREHTYVVKPRDTLWTIASSTYGGDPREGVWKIQHRNHLDGVLLRPGERLVLPP
jgi:nucleoid-associated protein YgaU